MEQDSFEDGAVRLSGKIDENFSEHVDNIEHQEIDTNSHMRNTTPLMIALSFFIGLGGFIVNFDIGYTGLVLVMEPFKKDFGSCVIENGVEVCSLSAPPSSP